MTCGVFSAVAIGHNQHARLQTYGEFMQASSFVEELVKMLDSNGDGILNQAEFTAMLSQNPVLFDTFANSIVPGMDDAKGPFQQLRQRYSGFSIDLLNDVRAVLVMVLLGSSRRLT